MKYILRCYDYYLSDVYTGTDLITDEKVIIRFEISLDSCKQFDDFEEAEEIRKLIFIETGLNLEIKKDEKENY